MFKKTALCLLCLTLCLAFPSCDEMLEPSSADPDIEAASVTLTDTTAPETEPETIPETEAETAPEGFVAFASEGQVFEVEDGTISYRVVKTDLTRGGYSTLEITVVRNETAEEYTYEGSSSGAEPEIRLEFIDPDGNRTKMSMLPETEDIKTVIFQPGETIVCTVSFYIDYNAPYGAYGLTLSHVSVGSVWLEDVFYLEAP